MIPRDAALMHREQFLTERIAERRGLSIGKQHHDLDRLQLLPLRRIYQQFDVGRLLCEVTLAEFRRENQRGSGVVRLSDQMMRLGASHLAHIKMLAKCANQRSRNWTLILIDDGKDDAFAAVARW